MKKIVIALTIVILLVIGSYGVFGFMAKKNFDRGMAEIKARTPSHIDITYKQGFLSSTVDLSVKIPIDGVDVDLVGTTHHTIYHGPFVFHHNQDGRPAYIPVQAYTEGTLFYELSGDIGPELASNIKEATTTRISAYIPLTGNAEILFSGEPLSKEFTIEGDILAVDWQGFSGSMELQGSLRDFTYDIVAPGLTISGDGPESVAISAITSSGAAHTGSSDIGLGSYKAGIKNIAVRLSAEPGDEVILDDMQVMVTADEKDGLLTIAEIFDIASFSFNEKSYGPANTTTYLRNLDVKALTAMNRDYVAFQKENGHDSQAMQDKLMEMVATHGVSLLSKSPELEFANISLQTAEGKGEAKLIIRFNGEGEVVMNPFFLLGRLSADASFGADERFLAVLIKDITKEAICDDTTDPACDQQAAQASSKQLQGLVTAKQLILENGRYSATISYKDGASILNGKPMPLF